MADFPCDQSMSSELAMPVFSSNSSTTSSTSRQTSPDNSPTSTASLKAGNQYDTTINIAIDVTATISSSSQVSLSHIGSRSEVWISLRESKAHAMLLERLQDSEKEHQKAASTHKKATRRLSKDMYQIVSLFAVMEGVVFAAVAQSSIFTCEDWWGPVAVAVAVMVSTIRCVLVKLRCMGHEKQQVQNFERRASAVYDKIAVLYWKGATCEMDQLEPDRGDDEHATGGREEHAGHCILSRHGVLVLGFVVIFSVLITMSCCQMLCQQPCRCNVSAR